jgi:D-alanyl-lipoteichoic acid acyltransferase DltB (MBOAT superfamily)
MLLFTWGLFKKVVIADRLAIFVDTVYNDVHAFTGIPLLLATYAYAFQIYMDFSGYTDMALGSAQLFNINLTQNFNSPYLATSIVDFWRRWHITFSRWILDYIFKPLQMHCRSWKNWGTVTAIIVTFLVSGIWHGASWGFVIWGGLHGLYMACSIFYKPFKKKLHKALGVEETKLLKFWQIFVTFNLVCFAWVFFRAKDLSDAYYIIAKFATHSDWITLTKSISYSNVVFLVFAVSYYFLVTCFINFNTIRNSKWRWGYYYFHFATIFYFGLDSSEFIYFQF